MKPRHDDDRIKIPLTFDLFSGGSIDDSGRELWLLVVLAVWLVLSGLTIVYGYGWAKFWYTVLYTVIAIWVSRFVVMREPYYKKRRKELVENDYIFDHSIFWDIYDISDAYPYFVSFRNGYKGVFVRFDKDVVIGKIDDANFYHHEAIANAYKQMVSRSMSCVHIDYMDIIGRDSRMDSLFDVARDIENAELKRVMTRIYSNIQYIMNKSYASYDVYCFMYRGPDDIFWDELQAVLRNFSMANYKRFKMLRKDEVGLLAKVIMNLDSFSANRACEEIFKETNNIKYLRTIWVERDDERKIINKTKEEVAEARRVMDAERQAKKQNKKIKFGKKKLKDEDMDLFS